MPTTTISYRSHKHTIESPRKLSKLEIADEFLRFACKDAPQPLIRIQRYAEKNGIGKTTLERAAEGLIFYAVIGFGAKKKSYWSLWEDDTAKWRPRRSNTQKAREEDPLKAERQLRAKAKAI